MTYKRRSRGYVSGAAIGSSVLWGFGRVLFFCFFLVIICFVVLFFHACPHGSDWAKMTGVGSV